MAGSVKVFRVFISSTFSDMVAERNALQEKVFPRLQDLCLKHGARFQAIDLRWGISEEAGLDQRAVRICLNEIARCQKLTSRPNFLLLMGDRYGWQPLPEIIPADEFAALSARIDELPLLNEWYLRDENAQLVEYVLKRRTGDAENYEYWAKIEKQLRTAILKTLESLNWTVEQCRKYETSVTEQEIEAGIFRQATPEASAFCFFRSITNLPSHPNPFTDADETAAKKLAALKQRIYAHLPNNIHHYQAEWEATGISQNHLEQFCEDVFSRLSEAIMAELATLETLSPIDLEDISHSNFMQERSRHFVGREDALEVIQDYIQSERRAPFIIYGQSGLGKSSLMAEAVQKTSQNTIYRFIGASPDSTDIRLLLIGIYQAIQARYKDNRPIPQDFETVSNAFTSFLNIVPNGEPLVIFLDALDQLTSFNNPENLYWLPTVLPPQVKIILSVIPSNFLEALKQRSESQNLFELQPMNSNEAASLLKSWFKEIGRSLQPFQEAEVLSKFAENSLPLYLKLAFEEARLWHSDTKNISLKADIPSLIRDNLFARLSSKSEYGELLVSRTLAYIAAARNGLSEEEILEILRLDKSYWDDFYSKSFHQAALDKVNHLPVAVWSRLALDLAPYMSERVADDTTLLGFYHRQFSEVVNQLYLEAHQEERHALLAQYFEAQALYNDIRPNLRKLSEQAYQQAKAKLTEAYQSSLTNYAFLQTSVEARGIQQLINDYSLIPSEALKLIENALILARPACQQNPQHLPSQLLARLTQDMPEAQALLEDTLENTSFAWLQPLSPSLLGRGLVHTLEHGAGILSIALSSDGLHLASAGHSKLIHLWELSRGILLLSLPCENTVNDLIFTHDSRYLLVADEDGNISIWDWRNKSLRGKLKAAEDPINALCITKDDQYFLSSASAYNSSKQGNTITLWDLETLSAVQSYQGNAYLLNELGILENLGKVDSSSKEYNIRIWNIKTGKDIERFTTSNSDFNDRAKLLLLPSFEYIAVTSQDRSVYIVDILTGEVDRFSGHGMPCTALACNSDISLLVTASAEGEMFIWDLTNDTDPLQLIEHTDEVSDVFFSPDDRLLISASHDGKIKVWDVEQLFSRQLSGHIGRVRTIAIASDKTLVATGSGVDYIPKDTSIKLWNTETGQELKSLDYHNEGLRQLAFSPDAQFLISVGEDTRLCIWSIAQEQLLFRHKSYKNFQLSKNGQMLIAIDNNYRLDIYEAPFQSKKHSIPIAQTAFAVLTDNNAIVLASPDNGIQIWNIETAEKQRDFAEIPDDSRIMSFQISPDNRYLIGALVFGTEKSYGNFLRRWDAGAITFWDLASGELLATIPEIRGELSFTLNPDSASLLAVGRDDSLLQLAIPSGTMMMRWTAHQATIEEFSEPNNLGFFTSIDEGGTAYLWHKDSQSSIASFYADSRLSACAIKDNLLILGEDTGRVHFLELKNFTKA